MRFGDLALHKPQLREIPFETKVFERYPMTEKALVNAIIKSYLPGISTRETLKECMSDSHRLQEFAVQHDERGLSRASDMIHQFQPDMMNYRSFPTGFWKKIRTTNLLESVNKVLKWRSRKICAFPNDASLLRLAGSFLNEMISLDAVAADFTAIYGHYHNELWLFSFWPAGNRKKIKI